MSRPTQWLMLRGLGREQRHWGDFPSVFSEALGGVTAHCLDLPGVGTEHHRAAPLTIAAIVDDLRARWTALRDAHPGEAWGLFGISLGGMVAQAWAHAYPDDFARVVLLNTSAADQSKPWERMSLPTAYGAVTAARSRDEVFRQRTILAMTTRLFRDHDALAAEWAGYQAERPLSIPNLLRQLGAAMRFAAPPSLKAPTLVLVGEKDSLAHPNCGRRLAAHYNAPLRVHPAAGHDLPRDAPEWVCREVARWLTP